MMYLLIILKRDQTKSSRLQSTGSGYYQLKFMLALCATNHVCHMVWVCLSLCQWMGMVAINSAFYKLVFPPSVLKVPRTRCVGLRVLSYTVYV